MSHQKQQFVLSCAGIAFTLLMTAFTILHLIAVGRTISNIPELCALFVFATIVLLLIYGGLVPQWARAGYFMRVDSHRSESRDVLDQVYRRAAPPLGILIPSYKEELSGLRITVLSAALVEYPNRHIVVTSGVAGIVWGHYFNGMFAAINAAMFTYGLFTFIAAPAQPVHTPDLAVCPGAGLTIAPHLRASGQNLLWQLIR